MSFQRYPAVSISLDIIRRPRNAHLSPMMMRALNHADHERTPE